MADQHFPTGTLMAGKRGLVMGVANKNSIAWAIARQLSSQGAELAFTYQGEALLRRVKPLAESIGSSILCECDVTNDETMDSTFSRICLISLRNTMTGKVFSILHWRVAIYHQKR